MTQRLVLVVFAIAVTLAAACSSSTSKPPAQPAPAPAPAAAEPAPEPVAPAEASPAAAAGDTGIPECDVYIATLRDLSRCDKLPPETQKALAENYRQSAESWKQLRSASAEDQAAAGSACKAASDALAESVKQMGCG